LFGAGPSQTYANSLACQVAPSASPFVFPAADAVWALQYQSPAVSLTVTNMANQTFPLTGESYAFLLVHVVNSVTVTTAVP
jgi:hypothetical protein